MFGFQRVGDLIWAGADSRVRGFLLGATAGRTTLAGEGLQHQDGHSHVYSLATPNCLSYDPAYAYELAVIIQDGIRRMYRDQESIFYYLTVMNEQYAMPAMPEGSREGILKGMYRLQAAANPKAKLQGAALRQRRDPERGASRRRSCSRSTASPPTSGASRATRSSIATATRAIAGTCCIPTETPRVPYVDAVPEGRTRRARRRVRLLKVLPDSIDRWMPRRIRSLGTDGFGRSEDRAALREFFEVDARFVALATLSELLRKGRSTEGRGAGDQGPGINPEKPNPAKS